MEDIVVLAKGVLAGLAISAPAGPVTMVCLSHTIAKGRWAGILSGLGAGTADTAYGAMAGFGLHLVIGFLIREEFWIRMVGGSLLVVIGARYFFRNPQSLLEKIKRESAHSGYVTALLLNLANPTVVLSFLAVLTALGLHRQKSWVQDLTLVVGIFLGAMLWWVALATVAARFRGQLSRRAFVWMNRIAGVMIGGFGLVTVILAHRNH